MAMKDNVDKTARKVLWYVTFAGFSINYMHRIHVNIILVGMVKSVRGSYSTVSSECIRDEHTFQNFTTDATQTVKTEGFDWDEQQQNYVLGSFFWFHWLTQIPGGILARRFGTKIVFGLANFIPCLLTFTLPMAAHFDFRLLVCIRVLQGVIMGAAWPSMHQLTAHWIPPNERSNFVSSYLGSSFGVAVTYPLCGYVMDTISWQASFYTTGFIAIIWFICWWMLVYDTPSQHPWISEKERNYIESSLEDSLNKKKMPVPWKCILLSKPLWMISIAQIGGTWGLYTIMTQAPTYFKNILGLDIKITGILSGVPHLTRMLCALGFGYGADYLLRNQCLSRTNVRKLATLICTVFQGLMLLGVAFSGCNITLAIFFVIVAVGFNGAVSSGPLACVVDLSPNFASICLGFTGMMTNLPAFISPLVVGYLTYQNQTAVQWQKVFFVTTGILLVTGILYLIYGEANLQSWNQDTKSTREQLEKLNKNKLSTEFKEMSVIKLCDISRGQ